MGLIKAAMGAAGSVMADQWKEYFYCEALPVDVLAVSKYLDVHLIRRAATTLFRMVLELLLQTVSVC